MAQVNIGPQEENKFRAICVPLKNNEIRTKSKCSKM
jgi:hypothetical protein